MEALVSQYLTGELALLVTCLMIIGKVLKTYKYLDNKWIPLVLLPISIVIVFGIKGIDYVNFLINSFQFGFLTARGPSAGAPHLMGRV